MALLQVIIASTRPGRKGAAVGAWFEQRARQHGKFEIEIVDLAAVTFFGSSGINALLLANRDAKQKGVVLVIAAPSPIVRQVLDATDLSSVFEIRG